MLDGIPSPVLILYAVPLVFIDTVFILAYGIPFISH